MKQNGPLALVFNALFLTFILAPLAVVMLVAFTDKGFIAMPFDGASFRWFHAIIENGDIVSAFWLSIKLAFAARPSACCWPCPRRWPLRATAFPAVRRSPASFSRR